uniref:Uncharacterized protein n=1 Tax=Romanomermis culicivorax TaxID=13658 RepID=A0A915IMZ9_ROMCU
MARYFSPMPVPLNVIIFQMLIDSSMHMNSNGQIFGQSRRNVEMCINFQKSGYSNRTRIYAQVPYRNEGFNFVFRVI